MWSMSDKSTRDHWRVGLEVEGSSTSVSESNARSTPINGTQSCLGLSPEGSPEAFFDFLIFLLFFLRGALPSLRVLLDFLFFLGFTGFLPGFTRLYRVSLGFYRRLLVLSAFHSVLTKFYWDILGFTGFYLVLPSFTGFVSWVWVPLYIAWFYWVLLDLIQSLALY